MILPPAATIITVPMAPRKLPPACGDVNHDGEVTTADYAAWYNSARAGNSGYQSTDTNLDGEVTTADYIFWYNNARAGASSEVP